MTIQWIFVSNALAWQDLRNKIRSTHGDIHVLNHLPKSENIICSPQKNAWRYTTSRAQSLFLTMTFVRLSVLPHKFLTHLVPDHPSPPALLPSCTTPDRPVQKIVSFTGLSQMEDVMILKNFHPFSAPRKTHSDFLGITLFPELDPPPPPPTWIKLSKTRK